MNPLQTIDDAVIHRFGKLHQPWLDQMMEFLSQVGNPKPLTTAAVVGCLLFLLFRQYRAAGLMALAALLAFLVGEAAKHLVHRPRPDMAWRLIERPDVYSFPSGHSLNSMSIYGTAALLTARRLRRRWVAALVIVLGIGLSLLIGLSRPYLGVHWPTDVLGGWCCGLAFALLAWWADGLWPLRHPPGGKVEPSAAVIPPDSKAVGPT